MSDVRKKKFSSYGLEDKALLITGYTLIGLFVLAIIVPVIYIIAASFMDPITLQNKGLTFDFSKWTLTAYERVISNAQIWVGFKNAVIYSVVFTVVSVGVTLFAAYPMSKAEFRGRKFFNVIFMITMFFGGGLIPTYLLIGNLGLLDSMWAIILPGAFSVWNMTIARTYYRGIPTELHEAADVDGASINDEDEKYMDEARACTDSGSRHGNASGGLRKQCHDQYGGGDAGGGSRRIAVPPSREEDADRHDQLSRQHRVRSQQADDL